MENKERGLYIHIPFCAHKCLFCSFPIAVAKLNHAAEYIDALGREYRYYDQTPVSSIYLGGGTPSLLEEKYLIRLMSMVRSRGNINANAEITIECNPETLTTDKIKCIQSLGFNRISLGAQSFNERYLKFLGRRHYNTAPQEAVDNIRRENLNNISVDLMYGFPGQTADELMEDLKGIEQLNITQAANTAAFRAFRKLSITYNLKPRNVTTIPIFPGKKPLVE